MVGSAEIVPAPQSFSPTQLATIHIVAAAPNISEAVTTAHHTFDWRLSARQYGHYVTRVGHTGASDLVMNKRK